MAYCAMSVHPNYPQRHPQRLQDYDYSSAGAYFVTLCVQDRLRLFGHVVAGEMVLSPAGQLVYALWNELPMHNPGLAIDTLVLMPDHLHALLNMDGTTRSLPAIIQAIKARTTAQYAIGVRTFGWPHFHGVLWQRGFHDRVIRDEEERGRIRDYMLRNPDRWANR